MFQPWAFTLVLNKTIAWRNLSGFYCHMLEIYIQDSLEWVMKLKVYSELSAGLCCHFPSTNSSQQPSFVFSVGL